MIKVEARAQLRADRAGEPLDGLVNMFDIGIVLAVGFLIAALQSLNLGLVQAHKKVTLRSLSTLTTKPKEATKTAPGTKELRVKSSSPVGEVYETPDGELVLVKKR